MVVAQLVSLIYEEMTYCCMVASLASACPKVWRFLIFHF